MKEFLLQMLIVSYGATGVVGILAYWPTIKDLYYHKKTSANISSYLLWSATGCISFLYSIFIISDVLLRIVVGFNFGACLLILFLSIGLKKR